MADNADPFADIYTQRAQTKEADPFADIYKPEPTIASRALDVAKQIPAGLAAGVEAAATFPAQALGLAGGLVEKYIGGAPDELQAANRAKLRELTAAGRAGVAQYLPKPETTAGEFARTGAEFIPSVVAGGLARPAARTIGQYAAQEAVPAARLAGVGATTGLVSEAAGQATKGTEYEPYARLAGAVVAAPAAARASEAAAARSALNDLRRTITPETNALYDQFRNSGFALSPQAAPTFAADVRTALDNQGLTHITADQTHRVLDDFVRQPFTTPQEFQAAYKQLGSVARKAKDSEERLAANIAQEQLLGFLENVPPGMVSGTMRVNAAGQIAGPAATAADAAELLQRANANWAALKRAETVNQKIGAAELRAGSNYSGLNLENELRRRVGVLGRPTNEGGMRGITPREREMFTQFGEGTFRSNAPRYLRNILGGGGGLGALGTAGAGAGLGAYLGFDPLTGGAGAAAAGLGLALAGNRNSLARAREIERSLLARAPLAAGRIPQFQPSLPLTAAPPTLATLGEDDNDPLRITVRPQ